MKIAIFTDTFYPMVNGVVTAVLNVAQPLADRGHKILIVTPKIGDKREYSYPGITIKRINSLPAAFYDDFRWTPSFSFSTFKMLKEEGYELVHFMTPFTISYLGIKLARMINLPVIGTFHTFISDPTYYEQMFKGVIKATEQATWTYLSRFYNAADMVTAPSPSTLKAMQENGCTSPGEVISNGIDPSLFDNSGKDAFREKYGLGGKALLYIGRLANEKNLPVLLKGFTKAWEKDRELQLLLVGDGPIRKKLQKELADMPVRDNIIFAGAIPHDELITSGVFHACRAFITASKTENQPMTILEAQTNGMVCIGADAKGIPDLIKDGVNGLIFNPDEPEEISDTILTLFSDHESFEKMRGKTAELIKEHKLINVVNRWEEKYSSLIVDYKEGKYEKKDYLHLRDILAVAKEFKLDLNFLSKESTQNTNRNG